ncbi:hypothetical protein [Marivirga harenae]|uniref:hypothetical protein n=1 Tax=Marivirga harenae TaxID=2010992 RepID=UPI0026DFE05F|nr:hypothetical protein [Marivirga harenae]WKV13895.1 hypothetical protein Q3Y49_08645 [Marivirga harenae]
MRVLSIFLGVFFISYHSIIAQDRIVFDDRANIVNSQVEYLLSEKFKQSDISLSTTVDIKEKCNYYFAKIYKNGNRIITELSNCDGELLGSKSNGENLASSTDEEKAIVIYYAVLDIIENPTQPSQELSESNEAGNENINSEHDSRYFFAPTSFGLKERELYYNSIYFLLHDIQYGLSDNLSIGMGTTLFGFPVYFTAKLSIPLQEKHSVAIGDMMILGTYGTNFFGNLAFVTYSYGDSHNNLTIGAGYLTVNNNDFTEASSDSFVGNFSGIVRGGPFFYFLTENYIFNVSSREYVYRETMLPNGDYSYEEGEYDLKRTLWYGLTGIRFVRKNKELVSWQIGLTHVLVAPGDIPSPYDSPSWDPYGYRNERTRMIAFPTLSYTRKFKLE